MNYIKNIIFKIFGIKEKEIDFSELDKNIEIVNYVEELEDNEEEYYEIEERTGGRYEM